MALQATSNFEQVDVKIAAQYAEAWQETNDLKAFLFHKNDIECILSERNTSSVRFYMGIKEEGENRCPDMMVVGVNERNLDAISPTGVITGIYNFTMPCPRTCDLRSDLYFFTGPGIFGGDQCSIPGEGRTVSTETECNIAGFEISITEAAASTLAWQQNFNLKSVLFEKSDLDIIFDQYGVDQIRVYFGLDANNLERVILVGVNANGIDVFPEDEFGVKQDLYMNQNPLCTQNSLTTCSVVSPLYHQI
jgi:hypothetical protein